MPGENFVAKVLTFFAKTCIPKHKTPNLHRPCSKKGLNDNKLNLKPTKPTSSPRWASNLHSKLSRTTLRVKAFMTPMLYFFSSSPFSFEPIILLNILILQQSFFILNIRCCVCTKKKRLKVCFLRFIEPERLSPYQLMVCSQKPKATRQSPHYFTQYFQVMSRILKVKMLPFQHFQAYDRTGWWPAQEITKSDIFHRFFVVVNDTRMSC